MSIEITFFEKTGGPLTKRIWLKEGKVHSDSSACTMSNGVGLRLQFAGVEELAKILPAMKAAEALALGALRAGVPDVVEIVTKNQVNGVAVPDVIARTAGEIIFRPQQPALALLDFDRKGMTSDIVERIDSLGGFQQAIIEVLPEIARTARVSRASTSAGLYRIDTGEKLPSSGGVHLYIEVQDGTDIDRFLRVLHDRCWLAGFGWYIVGAAGQLLDRSIVDRMVGAPERLVFEAPPILEPPLAQDAAERQPVAVAGDRLNTATAMPQLTRTEERRLREQRQQAAAQLGDEVASARAAFVQQQADRLVARTGMSREEAERIAARQCDGVLLGNIELPFDDPNLAGTTVADVLADPERFEGETLADPLEGIEYGRGKAKIMLRGTGKPFIHSFAHGGAIYELRLDEGEETEAPYLSEEQLALEFAGQHAESLRYVADWGRWLLWDSSRWRDDDTLQAFSLSRQFCRMSGLRLNNPIEPRTLPVARRISSAHTVAAVVTLARADRRIAISPEYWDGDIWLMSMEEEA